MLRNVENHRGIAEVICSLESKTAKSWNFRPKMRLDRQRCIFEIAEMICDLAPNTSWDENRQKCVPIPKTIMKRMFHGFGGGWDSFTTGRPDYEDDYDSYEDAYA